MNYNEIMSLYSYTYLEKSKTEKFNADGLNRILLRLLATLFSLFIFLLSSLLLKNAKERIISPISAQSRQAKAAQNLDKAAVLGQSVSNSATNNPENQPTEKNTVSLTPPVPLPTLTPTPLSKPSKSLITIAVYGDSMEDTMGEVLEYLDHTLKAKYPGQKFLLYNYGIGSQNVEDGYDRLYSHFKYQTRDYPSLPELKPDILIIGSFAYNPFTPHDRDRHWLGLAKLVQAAKKLSPRLYLLAEIAPLRAGFGIGPQGVNWSSPTNIQHSGWIIEQLQNAVGLSKNLDVPLIDAFSPSFSDKQQGNKDYVNPSDGIHPSVKGHQFMADKIVDTIVLP